MSVDEAIALSKDMIDVLNRHRRTSGREALVAVADVAAFVIKQTYKPGDRDEAVEWHARWVKGHIRNPLWHQERGDQSEEND